MGQKVSLLPARPQRGLFSTQPWPSPPWSSCWRPLPPRPFCPRQPSEPSPLPLPRVLIRPTHQSTLVASDRRRGPSEPQREQGGRRGWGVGRPAKGRGLAATILPHCFPSSPSSHPSLPPPDMMVVHISQGRHRNQGEAGL